MKDSAKKPVQTPDKASKPASGELAAPKAAGKPLAPWTDGQLVELCLGGNRQAFDQLVVKYQRQAVAVSYRLLGNTQDALEVVQDSFLKAYSGLAQLQKHEAFGGWLMRIVSNLSLNYRRGRKIRQQLPIDDLLAPTGEAKAAGEWTARDVQPIRQLQSAELGEATRKALAQLPEKQRLALTMFTIDEKPQKEIAEILGCSVEAVKWHVFQGRKKLKDLLKEVL